MRPRIVIVLWLILTALHAAAVSTRTTDLVDVNRASVAELTKIPGITATWAARIVRFRPYRTKLDLLDQGVVSADVYRRIRDRVVAHRVASSSTIGEGKLP
jgi:DNA uptake protein ComE-like DNA-binding protein